VAVLKPEYNSSNATCPGYTLNQSDNLVANQQNIDEDYAWENDIWVIGEEEGVPANDTTIKHTFSPSEVGSTNRFNGQSEYGGIIQVTSFNGIEPWVSGKPEFQYFVFNATGTKIKEREFPKKKRKDFKAPDWKDFGDFIGFWNTSNIGQWMIESWAEQDCRGGTCNTTTYNQNFAAPCTGCPSTSVSYTIKDTDYNMGGTLIQFTDPITTVYNITNANIKRKN